MKRKLGPYRGINNVDEDEALGVNYLREANNVDVTDQYIIKRRPGHTVVQSGQFHSLWNDGRNGPFVVSGTTLYRVTKTGSATAVKTGLAPGATMTYASVADKVFYSNGDVSGYLVNGDSRPLTVEIPNPPRVAVLSDGALAEGMYAIRLTAVNDYDQEGGASRLVTQYVTAGQGIRITLPTRASSDTAKFLVYVTPPNGDVFYLNGEVAYDAGTIDVSTRHGASTLETEHLSPLPAGRMLGIRNGRLFVARENAVWFSEALRYGLTRLTRNYYTFEGDVNDGVPVDGGWFVSTSAGVYFLDGNDPYEASLIKKSAVPAVTGTMKLVEGSLLQVKDLATDGEVAVWVSGKGFVAGLANGAVVELTSDVFSAPVSAEGAVQVIRSAGISKLVCTMKSPTDSSVNAAVGDRVIAEVRRNGVVID